MKRALVCLIMALLTCLGASAAGFCGEWSGILNVGVASLKLVLHLDKQSDAYTCTLDSPMQGAYGIACTASVQGDVLTVDIPSIGAGYKGSMSGDQTRILGDFTQMGQSLPLAFKRVVKEVEAPKPYTEREVTVDAGDGVTLAGTFSLPQGKGPFPAVVLLTGSGTQDRDETIGDHKPFAQIADSLTRHGIAVLRCDDRGAGHSSVASGYETTADFAQDALAMLRAIKTYEGVDTARVGYIGHSEGGLIAILNATKGVRFIVTLAAPAVKGKDLLMKQNEKVVAAMGGEFDGEMRVAIDAALSAVESEDSNSALVKKLKTLLADMPVGAREAQIAALTSPWYRYFARLDPTDALKALGANANVAMLALNGENDAQVDADQNLSVIKALVPQAQIRRYPTLNHLFQECTGDHSSIDYVGIPNPFSPQAIADIIAFITTLK